MENLTNNSWSQVWNWFTNLPKNIVSVVERRFGREIGLVVAIILLLLFIIFLFIPDKIGKLLTLKKDFERTTQQEFQSPYPLSVKDEESRLKNYQRTPLEEERIKGITAHPCEGIPVEVISEFRDVEGNEKFVYPDESDPTVVSAPDAGSFQGVKRYQFDCSLPWIATFSATPRKEESIGIFLEFEEVFRVLIGDGDRITWKVEKNDSGRKEKWTEVTKRKLTYGKITANKQLTVTIEASYRGGFVYLTFRINYLPEGEVNYRWLEYKDILFQPLAINLEDNFNQSQKFRIGINDSRFKGIGSEIRFGKFSVKAIR